MTVGSSSVETTLLSLYFLCRDKGAKSRENESIESHLDFSNDGEWKLEIEVGQREAQFKWTIQSQDFALILLVFQPMR